MMEEDGLKFDHYVRLKMARGEDELYWVRASVAEAILSAFQGPPNSSTKFAHRDGMSVLRMEHAALVDVSGPSFIWHPEAA